MANTLKHGALVAAAVGALALVSCQTAATPATDTPAPAATAALADEHGAAAALQDESLLALGTLELEGTTDAVTPEQATQLLPLWGMIEAGSLKSPQETEAVLTQIRGQMTDSQIAAIAALDLAMDDYTAWLEEQGIRMPATIRGRSPSGASAMTDEERAALREQFQGLTDDERATAIAGWGQAPPPNGTAVAGSQPGGNPASGDPGSDSPGVLGGNVILSPLIEMLASRAQE